MWYWISFKDSVGNAGKMKDFLIQGDVDDFISQHSPRLGPCCKIATFKEYEAAELTFKTLALVFPNRFILPGISKQTGVIPSDILNRLDKILLDCGVGEPERSDLDVSYKHLRWMIVQLRSELDALKAHRWLGYIQGVMVGDGLTTLEKEREMCRLYFME